MKHVRVLKGGCFPLLVGALVVGHGIVLYRLSSRTAWTISLGLILLVLLKHVGLLGPIYVFFKRQFRDSP